ncbi:hypothetical protein ACFFYR_29435 [Paraburkholderia dipogonis]|uniref:hypothetical protein n=1 Tax=Paraburkholderia dipogonis TaxID=1211383 RepID=UPI0035EC5EDF
MATIGQRGGFPCPEDGCPQDVTSSVFKNLIHYLKVCAPSRWCAKRNGSAIRQRGCRVRGMRSNQTAPERRAIERAVEKAWLMAASDLAKEDVLFAAITDGKTLNQP